MKDELGEKVIKELSTLRSKAYGYFTEKSVS